MSLSTLIRSAEKLGKTAPFEALTQLQGILTANPNNIRAKSAVSAIRQKYSQTPNLEPNNQLLATSRALHSAGKLEALKSELYNLEQKFPYSANIKSFKGEVAIQRGLFVEADESFFQASLMRPKYVPWLLRRVFVLTKIGQDAKALNLIKKVLRIDSENVPALYEAGNIARSLGLQNEALQFYHKATIIEPTHGAATYALLGLLSHLNIPLDAAGIKAAYQGIEPDTPNAMFFEYALGRLADFENRHQEAFTHFENANRIDAQIRRITGPSLNDNFNAAKSLFMSFKDAPCDDAVVNPTPIFIVGMPRSGTTLLEQLLGSHSLVTPLGEIEYFNQWFEASTTSRLELSHSTSLLQDLTGARQSYLDLPEVKDVKTPYFIDKMPINFLWAGPLHLLFPKAKFIFVSREINAVMWSLFKAHYPALPLSAGICNIRQMARVHEEAKGYWMSHLEACAVELVYEDLVNDPTTTLRDLLSELSIPFEESCTTISDEGRAIQTASTLQIRKGIYQSSNKHWEKYRPYFATDL